MSYITPKRGGMWESLIDNNPVAHILWSWSWTATKIFKEFKK